jgi:hypothetical protein
MVLDASGAFLAVRAQAGGTLSTDAYTVADFDVFLDLVPDTDGFPNNLMADTAWLQFE